LQVGNGGIGEVSWVDGLLGDRDVARGIDEPGEGGIRDLVIVDPETVDMYLVGRRFLGVVAVGADDRCL
jgi:hypothetical protein